mgnify:CR=1 FL=1
MKQRKEIEKYFDTLGLKGLISTIPEDSKGIEMDKIYITGQNHILFFLQVFEGLRHPSFVEFAKICQDSSQLHSLVLH